MQALAERRLVAVRHGRGALVLAPEEWDVLDEDVLLALMDGDGRGALLGELLECRRLLEPEAAALAAARASGREVRALTAAFERLRSTDGRDDPDGAAEADFHRALVAASGNRPLARMLEPVHAALASARRRTAPGRESDVLAACDAILEAVSVGQEEHAREAVHRDVAQLEQWLGVP